MPIKGVLRRFVKKKGKHSRQAHRQTDYMIRNHYTQSEKKNGPTGNRTRIADLASEDIDHYTTETTHV